MNAISATSMMRWSLPAGQAAPPEQPAPVVDTFEPRRESQEDIIRSMVRRSPDEKATARVVEALSAYPAQALEIVRAYGTRIEVYDFEAGDKVPEYLPTLGNPNTLGSYNTKANVLGMDRRNASPFTLMHEFAHALDAALSDPSQTPEWRGAYAFAANTAAYVRDYARVDSAEYMAEITTAYLVTDAQLLPLVERGLAEGANGMEEREFMRMHQNFSNGRLHSMDPDGYKLVEDLLTRGLEERPRKEPSPAMTEEEWIAFAETRQGEKAG